MPAFIAQWDRIALKAAVGFKQATGYAGTPFADEAPARRYALGAVKQRLHQATFRQAVLAAYNGRCALTGLPEPMLLDAAHIIGDRHEALGQPVVPNGLPLRNSPRRLRCPSHRHRPGLSMHVSGRLMQQNDGPMLEALKQLHHQSIRLPSRPQDQPDRDRLATRFAEFRAVN
ncbi:HNH endonuclease [Rhodanobacter lindaniclasticus]